MLVPVAVTIAGRRRPALLLWRQGEVRGYHLFGKGGVQDAHVWGGEWELVPFDPELDEEFAADLATTLAPPVGDAELVARTLGRDGRDGRDGTDVPALRSVLRRPAGPEVLAAFCQLLGIDATVAAVAEGTQDPATLPGSTVVTATSKIRTVLNAASAPRPDDPWYVRARYEKPWWYRLLNVLWVVVLAGRLASELWSGGAVSRVGAVALLVIALGGTIALGRPAKRAAAQLPPGE